MEISKFSYHLVTTGLKRGKAKYDNLKNWIEEGEVWFNCEEFYFGDDFKLDRAEDKIAYLAMIWNEHAKELKDCYDIESLKKVIAKNTGCEKVHLYNIKETTFDVEDSLCNLKELASFDYLYDLIFNRRRFIYQELIVAI